MNTFSFDISTITEDPATARITLTEVGGGDIQVNVEVVDGTIADLRGLFFNISDESLVNGLSVSGDDITNSQFQVDRVSNLGDTVNMNGTQTDFDGGVEIGTSGIIPDDIQSTTFTLSHDSVDLTLDLFENQNFGVRLASGGANRNGNSKLVALSPVNTKEDTPVDIPVLEPTVSVEPANGNLSVNPDGTVTYTPDPNFNGTDSYTITATVNIAVNPV